MEKGSVEKDQALDAFLVGPGNSLYAAVDEKVNERLAALTGGTTVYLDPAAEITYRLHFFELSIRGQNTKGENQMLYGELIAVREELDGGAEKPFAIVPADRLLDLPAHPSPPGRLNRVDPAPAADFLKSTYQTDRRQACHEER